MLVTWPSHRVLRGQHPNPIRDYDVTRVAQLFGCAKREQTKVTGKNIENVKHIKLMKYYDIRLNLVTYIIQTGGLALSWLVDVKMKDLICWRKCWIKNNPSQSNPRRPQFQKVRPTSSEFFSQTVWGWQLDWMMQDSKWTLVGVYFLDKLTRKLCEWSQSILETMCRWMEYYQSWRRWYVQREIKQPKMGSHRGIHSRRQDKSERRPRGSRVDDFTGWVSRTLQWPSQVRRRVSCWPRRSL
jgi:hypothetical protein